MSEKLLPNMTPKFGAVAGVMLLMRIGARKK